MESYEIIKILIYISVFFAIMLLFLEPLKNIIKFLGRSIISVIFFLLSNYLLSSIGFSIGINFFTLLFTAVLGIPGILSLYIANLIL